MRLLEVHLPNDERYDTVIRAVKAADPIDYYVQDTERKDRKLISVFMREGSGQSLIDNIQTALDTCDDFLITVLPVEATAPNIEEATDQKADKRVQATREEIYSDVSTGARLEVALISHFGIMPPGSQREVWSNKANKIQKLQQNNWS